MVVVENEIKSRAVGIAAPDRWAYAMGSFGTGVFSTVPSILLLYYTTQILGLAAAAISVIILLPKLVSLIWDPLVGLWSDSSRSQFGRRKPFLLIGAIGTSVLFVALFTPPDLAMIGLLVWVGLTYLMLSLLYSIFAVSYTAMPADIAGEEDSIVSLIGARMMVLMVGILIGGAATPILIAEFGGGRAGYSAMGMVVGTLALAFMLCPLFMRTRDRSRPQLQTAARPAIGSAVSQLRTVFSNPSYRPMLFAFILQALGYGGVSAAFPFLVTNVLGRPEADIGTGLGILIVLSFLFVPVWAHLGKRYGLVRMIVTAAIGYGIGTLALAAISGSSGNWSLVLIFMALCGAFFSGLQVLPFSLAADIARRTAPAQEAQYAGIWIAFEKAGLASGAFVLSLLMSIGEPGETALLFTAVVPAMAMAFSLVFLNQAARSLTNQA